ncbi:signal transduction histidine kinase [Breoghania corrubedonensis]|uniref:histidine kinase n=1 Tax=Breoghania corrubedonensis TaxID=665038 RepID=A0A2T5UU25_9HYPH|nr:ATP-binding protein [Breoghania corrubedonensis]PTW55005.1 signal transduction histidine kinase [Breoghania corrubedonensis]
MSGRNSRYRLHWPRSMAGQTMLLLVVGLMLTHAVSMLFYSYDRDVLLAAAGGREFAHRAAVVVELMTAVPAPQRVQLANAAGATDLDVSIIPKVSSSRGHEANWRSSLIRQLLEHELPGQTGRITVRILPARTDAASAPSVAGEAVRNRVQAIIGLDDGSFISITGTLPEHGTGLSGGTVASALFMGAAVLVLSFFAVRRMTEPLRRLARAADRLGRDVAAPPLDERGPDEVRRAARAFNEMQSRLRRYVEDRTQMLAAISHDLRTPITLLRLRAELIEDDEEREKTLVTLDEMEEMVRSTLAFAREDAKAEPMQQVDLGALVQSLCDDLAETGQPVECTEPPAVVVACRAQALRRAVTNLIENAVRYGHRAHVTVKTSADAAIVRVDDEGPGIPGDQISEVFRPFYRIEGSRGRATGGVGLGLSIVASVAYAHGGDVRLENRREGGLSVTLLLPR